jgi:ectoine hydroxylase-related dioxygenase (phytanoyl-CoA dioxygenase family)
MTAMAAVASASLDKTFEVTQSQMETYQRDGVVLLEQPFDDFWIDGLSSRMRAIVDDIQAGKSEYYAKSNNGRVHVHNAVMKDPFFQRFVTDSPAAEICARTIGSKTARFYFDVTFCKLAASEKEAVDAATSLHHDVAAFGFKGKHLPSFWLALTDVTEGDAPLVVALGSHKKITDLFRSPGVNPDLPLVEGYRDHNDIYDFVREGGFEMKLFPAKKGDVIVLNPYVVHASAPVTNEGAFRMGFSSRWIGDDVRWTPSPYTSVEAETYPTPIPVGSPAPDDWFPLMWSEERGQAAKADGRFNPFISIQPKPGFHKLQISEGRSYKDLG